jgi:tRNA threonylcarbamoyladenosine biosynthesis protein TsaB
VRVLGIETATTVCGVALVQNGGLLAERSVEQRYAHAETLFGFLDDVLEESRVRMRDLHGIAVSIGPGSFTGLRIGVSVVKGLHMATGIPVVAVPTLEALADAGATEAREAGADTMLAVLDARRGEVYWQLFDVNARGVTPRTDVSDVQVERLADRIPDGRMALTGEARLLVAGALAGAGVEAGRILVLSADNARCTAVTVAHRGANMIAAGVTHDVAALEPRYIKEFFLRTSE